MFHTLITKFVFVVHNTTLYIVNLVSTIQPTLQGKAHERTRSYTLT